MIDSVRNLLIDQVWNPLLNDNPYYTVGETAFYAMLFLGFVWVTYNIFERLKVRVDARFLVGWSGWILLMAGTRVLEDQGVLVSRLFITPYLDVLFASAVISLIYVLKVAEKRKMLDFNSVWMPLPYLLFIPVPFFLSFSNLFGGLIVLPVFFVFVVSFFVLRRRFSSFLSYENIAVLSAHLLDASATFVAIYFFSAFEKHVVPNYLIGAFGPAVMFPLKLIVVSVALYYIDKEVENGSERRFFKLMIYSLGIGTGLRDTIQILGY
ncbi:MAG: DUF63 family protein [Candidatus Aenigmarchaeota archaeon]|nr:DUF63 family protein [Candidatus Aenigmarchaeota archaeon]